MNAYDCAGSAWKLIQNALQQTCSNTAAWVCVVSRSVQYLSEHPDMQRTLWISTHISSMSTKLDRIHKSTSFSNFWGTFPLNNRSQRKVKQRSQAKNTDLSFYLVKEIHEWWLNIKRNGCYFLRFEAKIQGLKNYFRKTAASLFDQRYMSKICWLYTCCIMVTIQIFVKRTFCVLHLKFACL